MLLQHYKAHPVNNPALLDSGCRKWDKARLVPVGDLRPVLPGPGLLPASLPLEELRGRQDLTAPPGSSQVYPATWGGENQQQEASYTYWQDRKSKWLSADHHQPIDTDWYITTYTKIFNFSLQGHSGGLPQRVHWQTQSLCRPVRLLWVPQLGQHNRPDFLHGSIFQSLFH